MIARVDLGGTWRLSIFRMFLTFHFTIYFNFIKAFKSINQTIKTSTDDIHTKLMMAKIC